MVEVIAYFQALGKQAPVAVVPNEFDLHINLNLGQDCTLMYAADLTEDCVDFNKCDVRDAASLTGRPLA